MSEETTTTAPAKPVPIRPFDTSKSWAAGLPSIVDEPAAIAAVPDPAPVEPKPDPAPAPVQPPAKPEPEKESDERWPRSAVEWKKFRAARDEAVGQREKRIKELEGEMTTLKEKAEKTQSPLQSPEFDALKKERDELSDRLRITAVEKHPRFESYFKQKTEAQIEMAKRIVGTEKAGTVSELIAMSDSPWKTQALEELVSELPMLKQAQLGAVLNAIEEISQERQSEIGKAKEHYEKIQADEKASFESRRKGLEKMFDDAVAKEQGKDGNFLFQNRDGDEAWNNDVKERVQSARALLFGDKVNPQQMVQAMLNAMAYKPLLKALQFATVENGKLKSQVEELTKAGPKLGEERPTGDTGTQQAQVKPGSRPMDYATAFAKSLPALR